MALPITPLVQRILIHREKLMDISMITTIRDLFKKGHQRSHGRQKLMSLVWMSISMMTLSILNQMESELIEKVYQSNGQTGNQECGFLQELNKCLVTIHYHGKLQSMSLERLSINGMILFTLNQMALELIERVSQFNGQTGNQVCGLHQDLTQEHKQLH